MVHTHLLVPSFIQALSPTVDRYGYFAVGGLLFLEDFGVIVPGETVLIAAAFYAGLGKLNILIIIMVGIIAAVLGDNIGFVIGNYGGRPLIERYGRYILLTKERLDKAEAYFNHNGGKIIIIARFIDGLRQLNGIIAGISEIRWPKFLIFNAIGASIWVTFWSLLAYYGGSHISSFIHGELYITITVVIIALLLIIYSKLIRPRIKRSL